ncbi:MAG: helix-turn-helix domain-containing protein [Deltaproteobacteria bacterium]
MLRTSPMRRFYTTFEAAHVLGVSLPTVVNWIKARKLQAHRTPGGHRRIAREELAAFMSHHGMPLPEDLADAVDSRRRALVVGEPGAAVDHVVRQLQEAGLVTQPANPGFSAGLAAARFAPDVVLLVDPPADGGNTLAGLRGDVALGPVPIVAAARAEFVQRLRAMGCDLVLASPIPDGALAAAATQAVATASAAPRRRT